MKEYRELSQRFAEAGNMQAAKEALVAGESQKVRRIIGEEVDDIPQSLADEIREGFGGTCPNGVPIRALLRPLSERKLPAEGYPYQAWYSLVRGFSEYDIALLRNALQMFNDIRANIFPSGIKPRVVTVGHLRALSLDELRGIRGIRDAKAEVLFNAFKPIEPGSTK